MGIGPNGKPMLAEPASVWFNVAHSEAVSLIALEPVERGRCRYRARSADCHVEPVAERVLDDSERAKLRESVRGWIGSQRSAPRAVGVRLEEAEPRQPVSGLGFAPYLGAELREIGTYARPGPRPRAIRCRGAIAAQA